VIISVWFIPNFRRLLWNVHQTFFSRSKLVKTGVLFIGTKWRYEQAVQMEKDGKWLRVRVKTHVDPGNPLAHR
jgi:hypothetical protein